MNNDKTKSTPGPWRVSEGRSIEAQLDGEWVQLAAMNRTRWNYQNQDKNARLAAHQDADAQLIAAAPDLLAALKRLVQIEEEQADHGNLVVAMLDARAAIRKAEGTTQ